MRIHILYHFVSTLRLADFFLFLIYVSPGEGTSILGQYSLCRRKAPHKLRFCRFKIAPRFRPGPVFNKFNVSLLTFLFLVTNPLFFIYLFIYSFIFMFMSKHFKSFPFSAKRLSLIMIFKPSLANLLRLNV